MTDASMQPVITHIGLSKLMAAHQTGQTLKISHVKAGDGHIEVAQGYMPTTDMTDLKHICQRVVIDGGQIKGQKQNQLHLTAVLDDAGDPAPSANYSIYEIGFYLEDGTLFAIYASEEKLAEKVIGTDFILMFDITLTGDAADNIIIDGQAEWPLVQAKDNLLLGENLIKIHTQSQFDHVFNSSNGDLKIIPPNTTIILSPIQNTKENDIIFGAWGEKGDEAHNTFNARPGYILKNSIQFNSHTSVIGFNAEDTIVVNAQQDNQIIMQGSDASPVTGVHLYGWSYDGRSGVDAYGGTSPFNLSPFELSHADRCQLNCHIINHHPSDNIIAPVIGISDSGVNEALHVINVVTENDHTVSHDAHFNLNVLSADKSYLALSSNVSLAKNLTVKGELISKENILAEKNVTIRGDLTIEGKVNSSFLQQLHDQQINILGPRLIFLNTIDNIYSIEVNDAQTYSWQLNHGQILSGRNSSKITLKPSAADGTISVTVTRFDGSVIKRSIDIKASSISGMKKFDYTGEIEQWVIPQGVSQIKIEAWGAQGGNANNGVVQGGKGSFIAAITPVFPGARLNVVVGERGGEGGALGSKDRASDDYDNAGGGGGGASFIYSQNFGVDGSMPLLAVGGGGGASAPHNGLPATISIDGSDSVSTAGTAGAGGKNGSHGMSAVASASYHGGAGAGWKSRFSERVGVEHGESGYSYQENWKGGAAGTMNHIAKGGFGGGGGASEDNGAAGGGGGFSGGGASSHGKGPGGGGGSYILHNAYGVMKTSGVREGNGQIIISW
jgi:hypothetical protein